MLWYAVTTKPHQEKQAGLNLESLGVETFCPQIKRKKVIRRRLQTVIDPLFPGYIFARFDIERSYRTVSYARGVRSIVAFGPMPAPVDEEIIAAINARLHNGCLTVPATSYTPGQSVRIQEGPLQGLEAIFEREMTGQQRVVLLLRVLAPQWRVVLPIEQVASL